MYLDVWISLDIYLFILITGHCSAGDDSITSAMREVEEELGIHLKKEQLQLLFTTKIESIINEGK